MGAVVANRYQSVLKKPLPLLPSNIRMLNLLADETEAWTTKYRTAVAEGDLKAARSHAFNITNAAKKMTSRLKFHIEGGDPDPTLTGVKIKSKRRLFDKEKTA